MFFCETYRLAMSLFMLFLDNDIQILNEYFSQLKTKIIKTEI